MPDTTGVTFDIALFQNRPWPELRESARYLETCGFGTCWIADHFAWPPQPETPVLEAWSTLAALAASTERIRLGTSVTNIPLRHPAMVAKLAATVDCISGGRLDLGLGAGNWFQAEYDWIGVPHLAPSAAVARFAEAVTIIDRLLRERRLSFEGTYYRLADAPLAPLPLQQPRPPLVLAANGPKALRVAAQYADAWMSLGVTEEPLAEVRKRNAQLDEYCAALGRNPATLERAHFVGWAEQERPFASREALEEFVDMYREAGIRRFIFIYDIGDTTNGQSATRAILDSYGVSSMAALSSALRQSQIDTFH